MLLSDDHEVEQVYLILIFIMNMNANVFNDTHETSKHSMIWLILN